MGLEVKGLCFGYYKSPFCIKDASFSVEDGEKILLLGSHGMGKTTLLKILCGFETAYFGQVNFNSVEVRQIADEDKNFSLLPSTPVFLENKSIKENFDYFSATNGLEKIDTEKLCEEFEIGYKNKTKMKKLPPDVKRLLAIERCLLKNPNMILVDSVSGGLGESESQLTAEYKKLLKYNRIVVFAADEENYKNYKNLLKTANFNRILYIFDSKLRFFNSIQEFKDSFASMDIFKFLDEEYVFVKCVLSKEDKFFNIEIEGRFFELSAGLKGKLNALNLEVGGEEDVCLAAKSDYNFDKLSSDKVLSTELEKGNLMLFSNIDGVRII